MAAGALRSPKSGKVRSMPLARGAFAAIGEAGEAINESAFAKGRGEHPGWFHAPHERPGGHVCVAGRDRVDGDGSPVSIQVFLWADGRALMKALRQALNFAEADAGEAVRAAAEPSETARSAEWT
jgi:hypothetical protein